MSFFAAQRLRALLAGLCLATPALAQLPAATLDSARPAISQYRIDAWQTEQGLPMDTVQALLQTRDGAIWVGTGAGLARFDGVRFNGFEDSNLPDLSRRPVFGFMEDNQGRLWIGHSRGATRYRNGRFEPAFPRDVTAGRRVWNFVQDRDGSVWAATEHGLVHWRDDQLRRYGVADGLPTERLRSLAIDRDGTLWIATTGGGLVLRRQDRFETLSGFPHLEVRHVLADPEGGVWAATAGAGLVRVDAQGHVLRRYGVADGLPDEHLTYLARDASGALWIGHWGSGLSRLADGRIEVLRGGVGLVGQQIWSLHADREGSLWVGSWNGGLNRLRPRVFAVLGEPEGLAGNNTRTVMHARDGSSWVASAGGGVSRLHQGRLSLLREADGLPSNEASTLYEDQDGSVWIGSYTAGLARWRDGRFQRFGLAQGLPHVDVRVLLRDGQGRLWVGTKLGLARFDDATQRFEAVAGLPAEGVVVLLEGRDGSLWAGSSGAGLLRLKDGRLVERLGRQDGLASNWILALHEDEAGTLWIGTNGEGISRRAANGRVVNIGVDQGLWDGSVQALLPDRRGQFWISCNRGFFRVSRAELDAFADGRQARVHSVGYGPGDALRSTTFAGGLQPAGSVDGGGRIWLPSLKGVVIVDPERLPDSGKPPAVRVEEIAIDGRWSPLPAGDLQLPAGAPPLTLRYAADTVLNAERVRFRYQMEGLSPNWIDAGKTREARFAALPHGSYRFRVAASLDGQNWQETEQQLRVEVPPLPHQHPVARALALLLLLGAGYGAYRLRTHQLRRRQAEMEALVAEKTEALRQANEHLSRLSFSDALTGLANRRRLDEVLDSEWRRMARLKLPLAVVLLDIDAFKAYNDRLGHAEGDRCLAAVADVIRQQASRASDFAARYGGEEFVVLLPGSDHEAALAYAERLRAAVEARALPHPASAVASVVTLSLGVASAVPVVGHSTAELFAEADTALYRAKDQGRNRVC